jgi:hypothetical protein
VRFGFHLITLAIGPGAEIYGVFHDDDAQHKIRPQIFFAFLKISSTPPQRPQKLRLFPHFFLLPSAPL